MMAWALGFLATSLGFALASAAGAGPWLVDRVTRRQVVSATIVAAAIAAVASAASATGTPVVDGVYRALVVGLTTYLGSRLRQPVLAAATVGALLLSGGQGVAALAALGALGALIGGRGVGRSSGSGRTGGPAAVTTGFCALSLLQPGVTLPRGLSALASASILLAVCVLGYRQATRPVRRRLRLAALSAGAALGVTGALSVAALAEARPSLEVGVSSATRGAEQAQRLESQAAVGSMRSAAAAFDRANGRMRSPLARAGLLVPLLSHQVRAIDVASASGADLGRAGAALAEAVDPGTLRVVDGRIPLERMAEAQPRAAQAAEAISSARAALAKHRSPWLLPPLTSRLDRVQTRLAIAGDRADLAAGLLADVPPLLGSTGPRRYFVAVQSPSELRGSGGFIGGFAEIAVENGRLTLARTGRVTELNADRSTPNRSLDAPPDFLERYARFSVPTTWQSVTISPHFPSDAQVIRSLYPQSGGRPVDAVVAIDPFAIQAILQVVGPIQVAGAPETLTGQNAAKLLLFDQYRAFSDSEQDDRRDFLAAVTRSLTERLLAGPVPIGPLVQAMQPMVDQKRLMISAGAAAEEPLLARLGLTGGMAPLQGDALAVIVQNASPSKIDWFLRRKVDYAATIDQGTGALTAKATIQLTNQAPPAGLPRYIIGNGFGLPPGTSRMYVSVYSPLLLQGAMIDGQPLLLDSEKERGRGVYSAFLDVPAGGSRTLVLELAGAVSPDVPYRLDLHRQPSAAPDQVTVSLFRSGTPGPQSRREIHLSTDAVFEAPLAA